MQLTDKEIEKAANEHTYTGSSHEFHGFIEGTKWALNQMQPIPTSNRVPTKEDADSRGQVFVYNDEQGWVVEHIEYVTANDYTHWMAMPF